MGVGGHEQGWLCGGTHGFSRARRDLHSRGPMLGADPGKPSAPRVPLVPAQEGNCAFCSAKHRDSKSQPRSERGIHAGTNGCCGRKASFRRDNEERRRPKLTRSSRQRPPGSRTRVPWQCPLLRPSSRRGQIGELEIWKKKKGRGCPGARGGHTGHRPPHPFPIPHPRRPPVRPPPAPCSGSGFPVGGIAPRLREAAALETCSVTGKVPRTLGYSLS